VEYLLHERGVETRHAIVRNWWHGIGLVFVADICGKRIQKMLAFSNWQ
jgi:hypothetical protein